MRNLRSRSDAEECGEGKDDDGEKIGELKIEVGRVGSSRCFLFQHTPRRKQWLLILLPLNTMHNNFIYSSKIPSLHNQLSTIIIWGSFPISRKRICSFKTRCLFIIRYFEKGTVLNTWKINITCSLKSVQKNISLGFVGGGGGGGGGLFEDGGWTLGEPAAPTLVPYHGKGLNSSGLLLTMVSIPS